MSSAFPMTQEPATFQPLPPASLIICSRNRPELLKDAVASVLAGDDVPVELVIIDHSDQSNSLLTHLDTGRPCEIRYFWRRARGLSRARNDGIAAARYEFLVFTDDDVIVPPTWFSNIMQALVAAGPYSVVTGRILGTGPEVPGGLVPEEVVDELPRLYEGRIGHDVLSTINMAIHRPAIEAVGLFDERLGPGTRFPAAEDIELGFRLLERGYRILYVPQAVYHRAWRKSLFRLRWRYGRGHGAYFAKHLSVHDPYILRRMLSLFSHRLRRAASRDREQFRVAIGDLVFAAGMVAGAADWWLTQRRS